MCGTKGRNLKGGEKKALYSPQQRTSPTHPREVQPRAGKALSGHRESPRAPTPLLRLAATLRYAASPQPCPAPQQHTTRGGCSPHPLGLRCWSPLARAEARLAHCQGLPWNQSVRHGLGLGRPCGRKRRKVGSGSGPKAPGHSPFSPKAPQAPKLPKPGPQTP